MENQAITSFQNFSTELILHSHLVKWKQKQLKCKKYRKETFIYDGFMYSNSKTHTVLYIFDYKYEDRCTRKRLLKMQNFISRHSFDTTINTSSTTYLILNKTNSKCVDTKNYVSQFEQYILEEINILQPVMIICMGCYDIVNNIFQNHKNSEFLSAIKTPILKMLPPTFKTTEKMYQLHFEDLYFRKFGWNI